MSWIKQEKRSATAETAKTGSKMPSDDYKITFKAGKTLLQFTGTFPYVHNCSISTISQFLLCPELKNFHQKCLLSNEFSEAIFEDAID